MKKIIVFILIAVITSSLSYCILDMKDSSNDKDIEENTKEIKAVFISYIDYANLKGKDDEKQKDLIDQMIDNIKSFNFNTIILQVRPFCDAIYKSSIFETSKTIVNNEGDMLNFDILDYFIDKSHKNNIELHAWINPYRVRSTSDTSDISKDNIIYKWIGTRNIEIKDGIYLNPASSDVLNLILNGVSEIVKNYDVDGILYYDYFYPSKTIDLEEYEKNGTTLSIDEFRINNINNLIKKTYETIKKINSNVKFSISPAGNINNNLNNEYLDIEFILKNNNYLDYVMPQIYFGFENGTLPFIKTVKMWNDLILNNDTKLVVALSLYKSGNTDKYAGSGKNEWIENSDIIANQIIEARKVLNYEGFSIFRYEFLVKDNMNDSLYSEVSNLRYLMGL